MSTADIAVIALSADWAVLVGCGTVLAVKALDRARPAVQPDAPQRPARSRGARPLPAQAAERQEAYNRLRDEGSGRDDAAAALKITARTTIRDYEARYAAARNGSPS